MFLQKRALWFGVTGNPDGVSEQMQDRSQAVGKKKHEPWSLRNQEPVGREDRWDGDRQPAQFSPGCQQRLHDRS